MKLITFLSKSPRANFYFGFFIIVFCGLFVFIEINNSKFWTNDFRVYYEASRDFFQGGSPYGKAYGLDTGYFKYPPFTLYLFAPITANSYVYAQFIHVLLMGGALILSIPLLKKVIGNQFRIEPTKKSSWMLYGVFLMGAIAIAREFHMGNINLWLLAFFTLGLNALSCQKPIQAGIWWSLMIIFKPFMIAVIIPVLFYRKWRLIVTMGLMGVLYFLFPILNVGWSGNLLLWESWFNAIYAHGDYIKSYNALSYLGNIHLGIPVSWLLPLVFLTFLIGAMVYDGKINGFAEKRKLAWLIVFVAFIPNFFITDSEHFLISIPLFMVLFTILPQEHNWKYWLVFSLAMLLFSFNSNDLLGSTISDYLYNKGAVGIGNLLFIALFIYSFVKKNDTTHAIYENTDR
jgi:hypothetical protein